MATSITPSQVRSGIPELNFEDVDGYVLSDEMINEAIMRASTALSMADLSKATSGVIDLLTLYLTQHMLVLEQKETTVLNLPNNKEQWAERFKDLGLDSTIQGQMFKQLIRIYTNVFDTPEEQAKIPQRGYVIIS